MHWATFRAVKGNNTTTLNLYTKGNIFSICDKNNNGKKE